MVAYITPELAQTHLTSARGRHRPDFTPDQIDEYFERHLRAEQAVDFEAVMGTVAEAAAFELHPLGIVVVGRDAIRQYYERTLPTYIPNVKRSGFRLRSYGGNFIVLEASFAIKQPDSSWRSAFRMGVIEFDGEGQVIAERSYVSDALRDMLLRTLGDQFLEVPGVFLLTE